MTADAVGGVWTYALDLARGLQAHGVETRLAVNGPSPSGEARAAAAAAEVDVISTGLPLDWLASCPQDVEAAGVALARMARAAKADVVQLNSPAYAAAAGFDAPVVGVQHSCAATWWRAVRGEGAPWPAELGWRFDLARRGLLACDRRVAPCAAFAAAVRDAYGLERAPEVVWNGRAAGPPVCTPVEGPYVLTAGRLWDESKGVAVLDAAAAGLGAPVLAAGATRGPDGGGCAPFAHLAALGVLSAGELCRHMAHAAVFCAPSLYEPFGLAALEAAQAARPLVLSDIPTFRELWEGAAAFVPPGDAPALHLALRDLLSNAPRRAALGAAALARSRRYTVQAMADRMARIYASLGDSRAAQDQLPS